MRECKKRQPLLRSDCPLLKLSHLLIALEKPEILILIGNLLIFRGQFNFLANTSKLNRADSLPIFHALLYKWWMVSPLTVVLDRHSAVTTCHYNKASTHSWTPEPWRITNVTEKVKGCSAEPPRHRAGHHGNLPTSRTK